MADLGILYSVGIALILVGVFTIVLAILLLSVRSAGKGKVRAGGAVIIGPIPIIFGTDRKALKTVALISLAITMILLVLTVFNYLLPR